MLSLDFNFTWPERHTDTRMHQLFSLVRDQLPQAIIDQERKLDLTETISEFNDERRDLEKMFVDHSREQSYDRNPGSYMPDRRCTCIACGWDLGYERGVLKHFSHHQCPVFDVMVYTAEQTFINSYRMTQERDRKVEEDRIFNSVLYKTSLHYKAEPLSKSYRHRVTQEGMEFAENRLAQLGFEKVERKLKGDRKKVLWERMYSGFYVIADPTHSSHINFRAYTPDQQETIKEAKRPRTRVLEVVEPIASINDAKTKKLEDHFEQRMCELLNETELD
ncbi:hypothetical protein [Sulfitobacter sp. R18_1]|uniref:hypothetical protein n=1 Tax=Sulfitobacter sp. R18_1 TaxID=2821104 RepID=UPI001ADB6B78|nr:hypothetical protein [Sulfitobacter sp. R18_1]MBO9428093.1 hypothetical protein [Sulfitobacter sp. R18_1]